jgi:hypothetical protein
MKGRADCVPLLFALADVDEARKPYHEALSVVRSTPRCSIGLKATVRGNGT